MPLSDPQLRRREPDELMVLLLEETAELLQALCKAQRFGFAESHPNRETTNIEELCAEAEQVGATARILGAKFGINYGETCDARQRAAEAMWGADEARTG